MVNRSAEGGKWEGASTVGWIEPVLLGADANELSDPQLLRAQRIDLDDRFSPLGAERS